MYDIIIIALFMAVLYVSLMIADNTFKLILTLSISILLAIGSFMYIYSDSFQSIDTNYVSKDLEYSIKNTIKEIGLNDLDLDFKIEKLIKYSRYIEDRTIVTYKNIKVSVHTINDTSKEIIYSYKMKIDNTSTLFNKKELVTETLKVEMVPKSDSNISDNVDYVFTRY